MSAHAAGDCENAGYVDPGRPFDRCRTGTMSECQLLPMHVKRHVSGNSERQRISYRMSGTHVACCRYVSAHAPYNAIHTYYLKVVMLFYIHKFRSTTNQHARWVLGKASACNNCKLHCKVQYLVVINDRPAIPSEKSTNCLLRRC